MRSDKILGWLLVAGALLATACGNDSGVTGGNGSPTPTPTGGASPTPTPGAGSGNWLLTPSAPTTQACSLGTQNEVFPASITIPIDTSGSNFNPDWGLVADNQVGSAGIVSAPAGTVTGNTFSATWDYCRFDGFLTHRKQWTWTGTLANGGTTFTSTMVEIVHYASGDVRTTCVADAITPEGNCSSPGLNWTVSGAKQ